MAHHRQSLSRINVIVAYARSAAEEQRIEAALDGAGIAYDISLDAAPEVPGGAVCFLARAYRVATDDVARAKAVLAAIGLTT
jgi:hypothetical protein